jgi:tyrosinase
MAAVRANIVSDPSARDRYIRGVKRLKQEFPGPTTADVGIPGSPQRLSTYDLFVVWHHRAMNSYTPASQTDRNAAHRGPVFCPWHRFMLLLLELHLQRVLRDRSFGLPYWDWAADGELSRRAQTTAPVWGPDGMGGQGNPITTGPFAFNPPDATTWRVRIEVGPGNALRAANRGLRRAFGQVPGLPRKAQVQAAMNETVYDEPGWDVLNTRFRNRLEGWQPRGAPHLHNRVHVWVGGDMLPSSSPNDPVFYLNHCNVDRIWESWLQLRGAAYVPEQTETGDLTGHRIDDDMFALISDPITPRQTLDVSDFYTYDTLTVA